MIDPVIAQVPTAKQRRDHLLHGGTYSSARVPGLWRPMRAPVAPNAFPFGQEPDHPTAKENAAGMYARPSRA